MRIINKFHTYKAHIIDTLLQSPSQVHIAFGGWTSRNRYSFSSVNAFFFDEDTFRSRKVLLDLPTISLAHAGENMSVAVMEVLEEYNLISRNKVGYFVLDNASNNGQAIEELGRKLQWWDPASRRVCCFGHILHLVARAMLFVNDGNALEDLDPDDFDEWTKTGPVGKLHNLMVWVSRLNKATTTLQKLQNEDPKKNYPGTLDVILDNSTRWLSQYYMIERAIKLQWYPKELIDITVRWNKKLPGRDQSQYNYKARFHHT
jgi:hypothetical protein